MGSVTLPVWVFALLVLFAAVTFASHFLFPSVRWFLRRRAERLVARINARLERPIEPFKLVRRQDTIRRLIYDPDVLRAVSEHAREEGVREDVAFQRAERYAREIVPSFSAFTYYRLGTVGAKWLSRALYRVRLGHYDATLREIGPDTTVVFVMNHRSNMDYVLVTYLAADRSALSYAVGEWARVWPLSRLIKAMGAYFIRRKSRGDLYRKVLARYVQLATAQGVTQAIFPEGGLSLDGRLAPPKMGLLAYVVEGARAAGRDVAFVPVALNYDRVLEDRILLAAGAAGDRRFRASIGVVAGQALKQVWLRLRGRFHRFGYAAVSFGAPLRLSEAEGGVEELAERLMARIGAVIPILPVPLVALLIGRGVRDEAALAGAARTALAGMPDAHVHMPRDDLGYAVEVGLRALAERRLIHREDGVVRVDDPDGVLPYYAASIA
ncbi:MAG: 1-acyl-sn-glycerol-3-phosphate acyltransferase, partial [Shimia sp.]